MGYVPKGLWPNSGPIGKPRMLADATTFTLPATKKYNRAFSGVLAGVTNAELDRVAWARTVADGILWLYAPEMNDIFNEMGFTEAEGGFHTWATTTGGRLQQFADKLKSRLNGAGKNIVFTDWEGSGAEDPANSWKFSNSSGGPQVAWVQTYLAGFGKQYYEWHQGTGFSWDNKSYTYISQTGTFAYIAYRPTSPYSQYFHTAEDWLNLFANLGSVSTFPSLPFARMGLGYNNVTRDGDNSYNKPSNKRYHAAAHLLFAMMTSNLFSLKAPATKLLCVEWFTEDQGDRRSMRLHRFRPSTSMQGYVRGNDIRYVYAQNLCHDFILFCCLSRNVIHQHIWNTNDDADPTSALYYCSNRGKVKCASYPFVYNFEGTDNYTCPTGSPTYIGMEGKMYEAEIAAHETYATKYKTICDGINNQLNLDNAFEYRRKKTDAWTSVAASNGNEHILAWKHDQPFFTVWKNEITNEEVIFFWDLFATPKLPVEFRFVRSSTTITRTAHGNRAYHEAI